MYHMVLDRGDIEMISFKNEACQMLLCVMDDAAILKSVLQDLQKSTGCY